MVREASLKDHVISGLADPSSGRVKAVMNVYIWWGGGGGIH